eukprot:m.87622 g.87622  ORF g.87622 m.87622 type:complete len:517 (-) comp9712_c0_seq1:112-1662(-)
MSASTEAGRSPKRYKRDDVATLIKRAFAGTTPPTEPEKAAVAVEAVYDEMKKCHNVTRLTPLKLQKLIFFAHGVASAIFDTRLINEEIEGWPHGPVVPSVWKSLGYKGSTPLPFCGTPNKVRPSPMMQLCVALAVAAHGHDSTNEIKEKSHNQVWRSAHGQVWEHVVMPFDAIRTWFLQDEILAQEVVSGLIPLASPQDLDGLTRLLAADATLRSGLSDTTITPDTARKIDDHVVIWPNQTPVNALIVARTRPLSLYDVVGTQLHEGSENYLRELARLAGLGDWVALARLANHVELNDVVERYRMESTLADWRKHANDNEKFAFGVFLFLTDDESDGAIALWEDCGLNTAKVAIAAHSCDPGTNLLALDGMSEPYSSFVREDLSALEKQADDSDEAKYLFGLLTARKGRQCDAFTALKAVALRGYERAFETLSTLFPSAEDFTDEDLTALAKVTQGGRLALAMRLSERGEEAEAARLYAEVDTLNLFANVSTGDDKYAKKAKRMFEDLVAIALPEA